MPVLLRLNSVPTFLVLAALLLPGTLLAGSIQYAIVDLGVFAGGAISSGVSVNEAGVVAGSSDSVNGSRTFIWDAANGLQELPALPGTTDAYSTSLNNAGNVVGYGYTGLFTSQGFAWNAVNGTQPQPPINSNQSQAYGINTSGQVAGVAYDPSVHLSAFFWDPVGGTQFLGALPGDDQSFAFGLNDSGSVTGYSQRSSGVRFTASSGIPRTGFSLSVLSLAGPPATART
jgi:hypothetical protein